MKRAFIAILLLMTLPVAMHSAESQPSTKPTHDGPAVLVTVLWPSREKSYGLDAQLAALHVAKGKLLISTKAGAASAADFEIRFSWRASKNAKDSNAAPTVVAADVELARKAILAAMTDSYSQEVMTRVTVETPASGTKKCWEVIFPSPHSGVSLARQFRVARRLVAAKLVEMNMMAAIAGTWPSEFRPGKALALYDAEGVGYFGSTLLDRAVDETTLDACTLAVCGEDIREGILERCIGVIFPGGTGRGIAEALRPDGVKRVRDFVAKGGGYFGSCAGAYFASSGQPSYTGMIPLKHSQPWEKGKGKLKLGLTPKGAALLGEEFSHIESFYNCGPVFLDLAPDGQPAPVTVLAKFESPATDAKGVVRNEMVGAPAILAMQWQKGRIMIISPHPESNPKFYPLVARAIGWTISQDSNSVQARTPDAIRGLKGDRAADAPKPARPMLFAAYYVWYHSGDHPRDPWMLWTRPEAEKNPLAQKDRREGEPPLSGAARPLAGLYDSADPAVAEWHVRLAQAAGIDAFLVSWWDTVKGRDQAFEKGVLAAAEKLKFKVALLDERAQFHNKREDYQAMLARALKKYKDSPAYLRIDGKPVVYLYQTASEPGLTVADFAAAKQHVEAEVGPVYWIVDKIAHDAKAQKAGDEDRVKCIPAEWLAAPGVDSFGFYSTFSNFRAHQYDELAGKYRYMVKLAHDAGKKMLLPVHPGHDNSHMRAENDSYVMPRRDGQTLRDFLRAATDAGADYIMVTSWNEWPETTVVEPSSTWPDPYLYLKILAEWKGLAFTAPPLPVANAATTR